MFMFINDNHITIYYESYVIVTLDIQTTPSGEAQPLLMAQGMTMGLT